VGRFPSCSGACSFVDVRWRSRALAYREPHSSRRWVRRGYGEQCHTSAIRSMRRLSVNSFQVARRLFGRCLRASSGCLILAESFAPKM
jgi:hypothetical protein